MQKNIRIRFRNGTWKTFRFDTYNDVEKFDTLREATEALKKLGVDFEVEA